MKNELLVATHNQHKKEEIQQILGRHYTVTSLSDYDLHEEIVEDGETFHENAQIKAEYCFEKTQRSSLGDDSGLVIEALDGRPGIYSARYAGDHDFDKNMDKVLHELSDVDNRRAYFVTVLCLVTPDETTFFEGRVYGTITRKRSGAQGFGYDPIFVPDGYQTTFAHMSAEEKNKISHRRRALDAFIEAGKSSNL